MNATCLGTPRCILRPAQQAASTRTVERLGFRHRGDNPDGYRVDGVPEAIREYELTPSAS